MGFPFWDILFLWSLGPLGAAVPAGDLILPGKTIGKAALAADPEWSDNFSGDYHAPKTQNMRS